MKSLSIFIVALLFFSAISSCTMLKKRTPAEKAAIRKTDSIAMAERMARAQDFRDELDDYENY